MGELPFVDQVGQRGDAAARLRLSLVAQVRKLRTPGIGQSGYEGSPHFPCRR